MSDPKTTQQKAQVAETPRQEGAQGRTGKAPEDTASDGEIDASDPAMAAEIAGIADETHANA